MKKTDISEASPRRLQIIDIVAVTSISCLCAVALLAKCSSSQEAPENQAGGAVEEPAPSPNSSPVESDGNQVEEERVRQGLEEQIRAENAAKARSEASDLVAQMFRSSAAYASMLNLDPSTNKALPPQFPRSSGLTPAKSCCEWPDKRCHSDPSEWDIPTWQALNFAISDPHHFRYEYISDGTSFTAKAVGDLDCDGVFSTFYRAGKILQPSGNVQGDRDITIVNGDE